MRFFRIIKNGSPRMSLVQKFKDGDFQNPLHEVVYALPPYVAIQYYYQQFVRGNYAWESYPKKLEGITRSAKIKSVFYLDLGEYVMVRNGNSMRSQKGQSYLLKLSQGRKIVMAILETIIEQRARDREEMMQATPVETMIHNIKRLLDTQQQTLLQASMDSCLKYEEEYLKRNFLELEGKVKELQQDIQRKEYLLNVLVDQDLKRKAGQSDGACVLY